MGRTSQSVLLSGIQNNHIHHFIKSGDDSHGVASDFPGAQLILSSPEKREVWRQVLGVDTGFTVLR